MVADLATRSPDLPGLYDEGETESSPRILIVDNNPLSRDLLQRILSAEGFRTVAAGDAETAQALLRAVSVDLVLLDAGLPGRNGFELCAGLKYDRNLRDIPTIFLSTIDDPCSRLRGFHAGGVDYISKPFHEKELVARVRVHLRIRQAMRIVAVQEKRRLAELRQAQHSILVLPEEVPEAGFAASYRPLKTVGGDFYDVQQLAGGLFAYFVADVSGHGVRASFLTSAVKALLHQYSSPLYSAEETMHGINAVLGSTVQDGQYLTACYVRYYRSKQMLSIVSAGHPAPIHVTAGGKAATFPVESDPLAVFESVILDCRELPVQPGDRFYLYTDGMIEDPQRPGGGREEGLERLCLACEQRHSLPIAEAVTAISEDVRPIGRPADDDLLILGVEVGND